MHHNQPMTTRAAYVPLTAGDFAPAFAGAALISMLSLFSFLPLPREAGAEVSGHRYRTAPPSVT